MAAKNNIRSIRFSDQMLELIEQQPGENFTAKFETLVIKCVWELPKKEEELARIQKSIKEQRDELKQLDYRVRRLKDTLGRLEYAIDAALLNLENL